MEHRYDNRVDINIKILLFCKGQFIAEGHTRNVSPGGIFLVTNYHPEKSNLCVEILIVKENYSELNQQRFKAMIVHTMPDGIGLMIDDNQEGIASLKHTISDAQLAVQLLKAS